MKLYSFDHTITKSWDKLQILFECCGTENYTDWLKYTNLSHVPASCFSMTDIHETLKLLKMLKPVNSMMFLQPCYPHLAEHATNKIKTKSIPGLELSRINLVLIALTIVIVLIVNSSIFHWMFNRPQQISSQDTPPPIYLIPLLTLFFIIQSEEWEIGNPGPLAWLTLQHVLVCLLLCWVWPWDRRFAYRASACLDKAYQQILSLTRTARVSKDQ